MTRAQLLDTAAELFAERGFKKVTVREISEAVGANVAAVNYHFGDKFGLYRAIVEQQLSVMEETTNAAIDAGAGEGPDEQLRMFVRVFVERLLTPRAGNHIQRIFMREMEDPTPMLDVISERVMQPRLKYLSGVVGKLLGRRPDSRLVRDCVASVHAQCLMCKNTPALARMKVGFHHGSQDAASIADHISEFSLRAIASLAKEKGSRP
jgi:hypothetical protein